MSNKITIKPLVWEYHPAGTMAAPPTGFAYIIDTRTKGRVYSIKGFNPQREFASLDEAKAAAQSDYEQRVLSVLTDQPESPAQVETVTLYGEVDSFLNFFERPRPNSDQTHRLVLPADMKTRVYTAPDGAQVIVERIDDE